MKLVTRLRIGEKMALGFGVLGLTFLGVIWLDRAILEQVLEDSTRLQSVYGARQAYAYEIERGLAAMRGAEQAFLARRDPAQAGAVAGEAQRLDAATRALATLGGSSARTAEEIRTLVGDYRQRFDALLEAWKVKGLDHDSGLQGAFRAGAHRLEALMLESGQTPIEVQVLQLRRREKDYLLRGDPVYVEMVDSIAADIAARVASDPFTSAQREEILGLLTAYKRDFHALVAQDARIAELTAQMDGSASRISPLVAANLEAARNDLALMSQRLAEDSAARAGLGLVVALGAAVLGALFALLLTVRIVRPVREMAGLLDRLTHESPSERIATDPDGRDEINHMAIALNTLADHRARLVQWWRAAMQEGTALRELRSASDSGARGEAEEELRQAARVKEALLADLRDHLRTQARGVAAVAERLEARRDLANAALLREIGVGILDRLQMLDGERGLPVESRVAAE
jgi:methyl-accepting chemotaxis protein